MSDDKDENETELDVEEQADREAAEKLGADAVLHIRYASGYTDEGRQEVAEWLRMQADTLIEEGDNYAAIFTASYNPDPETEM